MSTGMDANVVTRPLIILAAKWQMMLSWKYTVCVCGGGGGGDMKDRTVSHNFCEPFA